MFMIIVSTMLTIIIEVMGIKTLPRSDSILISPGNLPNQLNSQGAKCIIAPRISKIAPAIMIHRAIKSILYNNVCIKKVEVPRHQPLQLTTKLTSDILGNKNLNAALA
jgi:hypothetical protein